MKRFSMGLLSLLVLGGTLGSAFADVGVIVESRSYPQSVGSYAGGSLVEPDAFLADPRFLVKLFPARDRHFGSLDLATFLQSTAQAMSLAHPGAERLQVGDLSQRQGGFISGHGSHQNGLDVDLAYYRTDGKEFDPNSVTSFPVDYVSAGRLSTVFDLNKNLKLMELLQSSGRVNRIFVDPLIKHRLCLHAAQLGRQRELTEVLRILRPWPNHADHLHVRLTCPSASTSCVPQAPIPAGDGCGDAAIQSTLPRSETQQKLLEGEEGC